MGDILYVLQCVAVCCSVLQCVAVCCSVLQCVAVCCHELGGCSMNHLEADLAISKSVLSRQLGVYMCMCLSVCLSVCVCVCVRARARVYVRVCVCVCVGERSALVFYNAA